VRKATLVALRHGWRPSRLIGLWAAVVLATAGVAAVANVSSPDGIQGTGHHAPITLAATAIEYGL
jgi:hypothetical protein